MKAAWDRSEEFDILGRTKTRLELWEEHRHWRKRWNAWKIPSGAGIWFRSFVVAMACSIVGAKILQNMRQGPCWEGVWPHLDPWDVVRLSTSSSPWNVR